MVIQPYDDSMADEWDAFVEGSAAGTLLHTRRFISYHGERFADRSLVVRDPGQRIFALFPAALMPSDNTAVMSHPGITYGGVLGNELCRGETMVRLLQAICDHYATMGIGRLLYKAVPNFYHRMPVQDDLYALFRMGATRYRCDLSATIDLQHRGRVGSRRKRGYKTALKAGVRVASGAEHAAPLWEVLSANLVKHDAKPVHTLDEILLLHERFPNVIRFVVALLNERVEAGLVLFQAPMVSHAQYIASSDAGYGVNALDMLFEHSIADAEAQGKRYFDFGISNEEGGRILNEGLYTFKSEFGAGGCVHEFYEIEFGG
jgi:hypothetical protein